MAEKLHICAVCAFEYEPAADTQADFHELTDDWDCPSCGIAKDMFHHYSCDQMVAEMTGMLGPDQPFTTVELPHLNE
jgi:rubredoxin